MHSIATLWCEDVARFTATSKPRCSVRIFSRLHHCARRADLVSEPQLLEPGMSSTPRTACASECFATPSTVLSMYSTKVCSPSAMVGPSTTTSTRKPMRAGAP